MSEVIEIEAEKEIVEYGKIESLLINGNLEAMNENERVEYYGKVCQSVGLNPLTKPFDYIKLNGKLTLYANKNCAEQLRRIYKVSIVDMSTEIVGDVLVAKCKVQDGYGRIDLSTGVVPLGNLKGEALANAIMKADTKAKRRATLSICGLGMLDETELETIKRGVEIPEISKETKKKIEKQRKNNDEFRETLLKRGIKEDEFIEFSKFANIKGKADVEAFLNDLSALDEIINKFKNERN